MTKKLTDRQQLFALEYIIDMNGTQAAIRAGYSEKTASQMAYKLLNDDRVNDAVDKARAERNKRLRIDADAVLYHWWQIANADPNELTQLRRLNCRYCWGADHNYQWTPKEYEHACEKATANNEPEPLNVGGTDYDRNKAPNPDCPECGGDGAESVYFADTTTLSPQAKLLYQGVKQTKFGIEVMTADKMKALDNVARYLGMFEPRPDEDDTETAQPVQVVIEVKDARKPES